MLSPHEFATLMLVKDTSDPAGLNRAELDALVEHQLVALENLLPEESVFPSPAMGIPFFRPSPGSVERLPHLSYRLNRAGGVRLSLCGKSGATPTLLSIYSRDPACPSAEPVSDRHSGAS